MKFWGNLRVNYLYYILYKLSILEFWGNLRIPICRMQITVKNIESKIYNFAKHSSMTSKLFIRMFSWTNAVYKKYSIMTALEIISNYWAFFHASFKPLRAYLVSFFRCNSTRSQNLELLIFLPRSFISEKLQLRNLRKWYITIKIVISLMLCAT